MARGHENLIPFNKRTEDEQRKIRSSGGKASGESTRRKADFRKALNAILTSEVYHPDWTPFLEAQGIDSTVEAVVNAAMIAEAMRGNVKAYEAIAKYSGQSDRTEADQEEQRVRTAAAKAKNGQEEAEEEQDDGFMDALKGSAAEDWGEFNGPGEPEEEGGEDDEGQEESDI